MQRLARAARWESGDPLSFSLLRPAQASPDVERGQDRKNDFSLAVPALEIANPQFEKRSHRRAARAAVCDSYATAQLNGIGGNGSCCRRR
jgi:hypothetical protein